MQYNHFLATEFNDNSVHVCPLISARKIPLYNPCLLLLAIAIADSCGNFLEILSFQNLPLEYVSILLLFTVPFTVLFSKIILNRKNTFMQLVGISLTIIGVFLTIYSYIDNEDGSTHYNYVSGTIYALGCCLLLSLSNVIQEHILLKGCSYIQLLGVMGCINVPITAIEALINGEYPSLVKIFQSTDCCILVNSLLSFVRSDHIHFVLNASHVFDSCFSNNV